uniref:Retrotransposon protein, putative, Ty1-copia subclass n=1 Tax=Tanacetum cinerariifolium TaxID=118510 RepID=A0A6L2NCR1_TANCI|nr:retrotransposon protein, putative, Ty1-copia subclass [Tanacetum cinerariifolium]
MQMLYCFVNNIHVDLLWEGLHYSLEHPSTLIPYPRFAKLTMSHYMTAFPEISHRICDKYHNLENDEMVKSIFNSGKNKAGVGIKIHSRMITDEMKLTEHYRMYVIVFGVDVPTTPSQPIESTQGTQRTTSAPSITKQKSRDDLEAKQNKEKVKDHLMAEEIEKLVKRTDDVGADEVDSSTLRQTRLEPRSNKESSEVEITTEVQPVNINEEEKESPENDYELKRKEKGKEVEETMHSPSSTTIRSPRIHSTLISSDTKKLQELTVNDLPPSFSTPSSSSPKPKLSASQHIITRFMPKKKFYVLAQHLQEVMEESLPKIVDTRVQELTKTQVPIYVGHGLIMERHKIKLMWQRSFADAIKQDRENLRAEITSQINNTITNHIPYQVDSSVKNYMPGHILHLQQDDLPIWLALKYKYERLHVSSTPCRPFAVCPRDQDDPHDDAHPERENSAKRQKTSEHGTYVFGESSSGQVKESELGPSTSENLELENIVMSLHKFPAVIFPDDDIEEKTSIWVDKCVKKFNPYARYNVEHWKNAHAKIYTKKQKEPEKAKEVVYSNSKIAQIIKTYWKLGHEHKFIKEIIARRANGSTLSITKSDYKNLNKNDIEDIYLLIVNGKLGVGSYQQKVNLTAPTLIFPGIEKYKVLSFWDYALESAVRILNMVPTKKVDKTPYEIWHGKAPNLSFLKV